MKILKLVMPCLATLLVAQPALAIKDSLTFEERQVLNLRSHYQGLNDQRTAYLESLGEKQRFSLARLQEARARWANAISNYADHPALDPSYAQYQVEVGLRQLNSINARIRELTEEVGACELTLLNMNAALATANSALERAESSPFY